MTRESSGPRTEGPNPAGEAVAIVGGGIVGLTAARVLAGDGHRVDVFERGAVGAEASRAAAGMLIPLAESDPGPFRALALASFELYADWVGGIEAETGTNVGFERSGHILFAADPARLARLREVRKTFPRDARVEVLAPTELARIEPALRGDLVGGLYLPDDAHVDNRRLVPALARAATRRGVRIHENTDVVEIRGSEDGVSLTTAGGERFPFSRAVVAAGAWTSTLNGVHPGLGISPVRGQMVALRMDPSCPLRHIVDGGDVYMLPRRGRVLVGGTVEHRGFDRSIDPEVVERQRAAAARAVPCLENAPVDEVWVGFRPGSANALPVFGWDPQQPAIYYATGHYRNGILLAAITERIVQEAFRGGCHPLAEPFVVA